MGRKHYNYWVEVASVDTGGWRRVSGSLGNRSYATGWMHGINAHYPSPAVRLMRQSGGFGDGEVMERLPANEYGSAL